MVLLIVEGPFNLSQNRFKIDLSVPNTLAYSYMTPIQKKSSFIRLKFKFILEFFRVILNVPTYSCKQYCFGICQLLTIIMGSLSESGEDPMSQLLAFKTP